MTAWFSYVQAEAWSPLHLMCVFKLQTVKFILNPDLALCHLIGSLARLELGEISVASPLGFELSLANCYRLLAATGERLPQGSFLVLSLIVGVIVGLAVELLMILDKEWKGLQP